MSRIGKRPVAIPSGVTANIDGKTLSVKGPKGTLTMGLSDLIDYKVEDEGISVKPANDTQKARAFWGMQRTMVSNLDSLMRRSSNLTMPIIYVLRLKQRTLSHISTPVISTMKI